MGYLCEKKPNVSSAMEIHLLLNADNYCNNNLDVFLDFATIISNGAHYHTNSNHATKVQNIESKYQQFTFILIKLLWPKKAAKALFCSSVQSSCLMDRMSAPERISMDSIPGRVNPKFIKLGFSSFPA